jgi:hypothetical protein
VRSGAAAVVDQELARPDRPDGRLIGHGGPDLLHQGRGNGAVIAPGRPRPRDGKDDDWAEVPVMRVVDSPGLFISYHCRTIKMARDDRNVYVLFTLGLGVIERYEKQMAEKGSATSGAIGYLHLSCGDEKFTIWVPTGVMYKVNTGTGQQEFEPFIEFEVGRGTSTGSIDAPLFEAEWPEDKQYIGVEGKCVELAIPLSKLQITSDELVRISLDEM